MEITNRHTFITPPFDYMGLAARTVGMDLLSGLITYHVVYFSRTEGGIRTRDPHLGTVFEFVHGALASSS